MIKIGRYTYINSDHMVSIEINAEGLQELFRLLENQAAQFIGLSNIEDALESLTGASTIRETLDELQEVVDDSAKS